jgi:hypothetical protein
VVPASTGLLLLAGPGSAGTDAEHRRSPDAGRTGVVVGAFVVAYCWLGGSDLARDLTAGACHEANLWR